MQYSYMQVNQEIVHENILIMFLFDKKDTSDIIYIINYIKNIKIL